MVKLSKEKWESLPQEMLTSAAGIQELFLSFEKMSPEQFEEVIDILFNFNLSVYERTNNLRELLDRIDVHEELSNLEVAEDLVNTMEEELAYKKTQDECFDLIIPLKVRILKLAVQERFAKASEVERRAMVEQAIQESNLQHE